MRAYVPSPATAMAPRAGLGIDKACAVWAALDPEFIASTLAGQRIARRFGLAPATARVIAALVGLGPWRDAHG